ncbi:leucine-rich repeat extensin-like protein 3 [Helianthus annuus]|uniref:leucine-rich repeat extensin-like protein 3 n=1 Tax=Helianthus annuus TaxID=4232 RepID=UPI001652D539|nr:leucine-rich repeat extensin-like protein 3 [Helianthus annuus]
MRPPSPPAYNRRPPPQSHPPVPTPFAAPPYRRPTSLLHQPPPLTTTLPPSSLNRSQPPPTSLFAPLLYSSANINSPIFTKSDFTWGFRFNRKINRKIFLFILSLFKSKNVTCRNFKSGQQETRLRHSLRKGPSGTQAGDEVLDDAE